tara:strand:- start:1233 stop:1673 length:441 start_codon:yes stop_codon:yes gene_type:complete
MDVSSIGSGYFDFAAMQARFQEKVTEADADGSGGLSFAEFEELEANRPAGPGGPGGPGSVAEEQTTEERFDSLDTNGDGEVTLAELEAGKPSFEPTFSASNLTELLSAQEESSSVDAGSEASDDLINQLFARLQDAQAQAGKNKVA